ncbi:bifunctional diguanylate cyclase/phosphodiesterase [Sulfurospirillum sp. 1612]|uniref:bifunctional diguanylate cyclase/phosphodiesterase n=1 Tax=Sulfurospirillum sp. 1612 TaxID=3094835 RepID=UPI002F93BA10
MEQTHGDSDRLLKIMIFIFIFGFLLVSAMLIFIFTKNFFNNYNHSTEETRKQYERQAKVEALDRIEKLSNFINIYERSLEQSEQNKVKNSVDFGIDMIQEVYNQYKSFPKTIIFQKIRDKMEKLRFFDNKSGYFFVYDLKGLTIALPTSPQLEGTNQYDLKDAQGKHIIQDAIKIVKTKGEGFDSWYWYKINEKKMKKKIGYVKLFKPLNIFIGTGRYEEDILINVKKELKRYLQSLDENQYGYIFAYNSKGERIEGKGEFQSIQSWDEKIRGRHIVKDIIHGAKIVPEGFFLKYHSTQGENRTAYVRDVPMLNWIVGTNVQDTKKVYQTQIKMLQKNLKGTIYQSITISVIVLFFMATIFLFIALKLQSRFRDIQEILEQKNKELWEQKNIFETIFNESYDGIIISKNMQIIDCNNAAVEMFGYPDKEALLHANNEDLMPTFQENGKHSLSEMDQQLQVVREHGYAEFELRAKKASGTEFWIHFSVTRINLKDGPIGHFVLRDVTENKKIEQALKVEQSKLVFQTKHDILTSLPNRALLIDRLSQNLKYAARKQKKVAVAFLDIDNFKNVNDIHGHDIGDLLLKKVATTLQTSMRNTDTVARLGGDEFVIILDELHDATDCSIVLKKIIKNLDINLKLDKDLPVVSVSIGIAIYPNDAKDVTTLLKYADMAMYKAKEEGKSRYVFYDHSMHTHMIEHLKIENELQTAIKNDEFILHYQPQIDIKTQKVTGFEVLIRWQHPERGLLYPASFIEIAEESDLIISIGNIVMKKAMLQTKLWHESGYNPGLISINFATKQLESEKLSQTFESMLQQTGCNPKWLEIEILERFVMKNPKKSIKMLSYFINMGVSIAIDDFGTGYSSMNYLKLLPITKLKIDQSFIRDITVNKKDLAISKSIIDLAKGLDLKILAEGVETKEQFDLLSALECEIVQGYYFSRPLNSEKVEMILQNDNHLIDETF